MAKVIYRTYDKFNYSDNKEKEEVFEFCYKKALKCGLECERYVDENQNLRLYLYGTKLQLFKYYIITISKSDSKIGHIGRCIKVLF